MIKLFLSHISNIFGEKHIKGTHDEVRRAVARALRVDPSAVVFSFHKSGYKTDFRILSITRSNPQEFANSFYGPQDRDTVTEHYESMLPASATNTVGILERIVCRYGYRDEDYCSVLFKYRQRGLTRRSLDNSAAYGALGWYEHPIQGHLLNGPAPSEVFPGIRAGDLFVNWVEFPIRCQVWRYRNVTWSPFKEAGWDPLTWGFQDEVTGDFLVILANEHRPAFIEQETFEEEYKNGDPMII